MNKISKYRKLARPWKLPEAPTKCVFIDNYFIRQNLSSLRYSNHPFESNSSDDCGQSIAGTNDYLYYSTSLYDIEFNMEFESEWEDRYFLKLTQRRISKTITYSFITNSVVENNAEAEILKDFQIGNIIYTEVMHFKFLEKLNPNELKELFYAKGVGVVKFSTENGNEFIVQ